MSDQWKLVPVEPTEEMLAAARPSYSSNIGTSDVANREKYQRMLNAAPTQGADARPVAWGEWDTQIGKERRLMMVSIDKESGCRVALYDHPAASNATASTDDARPVAIYQFRSEDGSWLDVEKAMYDKYAATPDPVLHRIVYATRDAEPSVNEQRYLWLREQRWNESNVAVVLAPRKAVKLGYDCPSGQRLDEIIDAARSASAPRNET